MSDENKRLHDETNGTDNAEHGDGPAVFNTGSDDYREIAASKLDKRLAEFEKFLTTDIRRSAAETRRAEKARIPDRRERVKPARDTSRPRSGSGRPARKLGRKPSNAAGNIHAGHRERMRKTVRHDPSLEALSDIEVLEYILAHAVPYKDTNPAAHALIDKYGSLSDVFRATEDEIASVPNVTRNAARLLKLLPHTYESGGVREMDGSAHMDILSFVLSLFVGDNGCGTFVAYFDERFGLAAVEKMAPAGKPISNVRLRRDIVGSVCKYGAKYVMIAVREKDVFPKIKALSREVENIKTVLDTVDARLSDYVVVSDFGYYTLGTTARHDVGPEFVFIPVQMFSRAPELVTMLMNELNDDLPDR